MCTQSKSDFKCQSMKVLKSHNYKHFNQSHNGISCSYPQCSVPNKKFLTANALRIHMSKTHREKKNFGGDNDISSHKTIADDGCNPIGASKGKFKIVAI